MMSQSLGIYLISTNDVMLPLKLVYMSEFKFQRFQSGVEGQHLKPLKSVMRYLHNHDRKPIQNFQIESQTICKHSIRLENRFLFFIYCIHHSKHHAINMAAFHLLLRKIMLAKTKKKITITVFLW